MSDGFGKNYTTSLDKVLRGSDLVDFEKINSLEGVFLANKQSNSFSSDIPAKPTVSKPESADESTMMQQRLDKMRRSQQQSNINKKQQQTRESVQKDGLESGEGSSNKIRTLITHNKGGKWELIKAPSKDSENNNIECFLEEGCSLNLEIYSSNGRYAPPYS